ncbi:MAG: hypothetical protein AB4290_31575, partial [Spirulina sp.]
LSPLTPLSKGGKEGGMTILIAFHQSHYRHEHFQEFLNQFSAAFPDCVNKKLSLYADGSL